VNSEYLQLGDTPVLEVAHQIFGCFLFDDFMMASKRPTVCVALNNEGNL
jgi:hypothetical protein